MKLPNAKEFIARLAIENDAHRSVPLGKVIVPMMDFAIRTDIAMGALRMLDIPMEVFLPSCCGTMGHPFVSVRI